MLKGGVISLFLIVLWVLAQILVFRLSATRQLFRTFTLLFLPTLPAYAACYLGTPPTLGFLPQRFAQSPFLLGLLSGLILHLLFYLTYAACFYYVDRPLTLRILIAFLKAPRDRLTLSEIKAIYELNYMIKRRLEAMRDGGFVMEREGRYFLTPKGEFFGRVFRFGRGVLKIDRNLH